MDIQKNDDLLLEACIRGSFLKVKRLLKGRADVNAKNEDGCTPLHIPEGC